MRWITRFLREECAATAVEYAVMLAMILGTIFAGISLVGGETDGLWGGIYDDLDEVGFFGESQ